MDKDYVDDTTALMARRRRRRWWWWRRWRKKKKTCTLLYLHRGLYMYCREKKNYCRIDIARKRARLWCERDIARAKSDDSICVCCCSPCAPISEVELLREMMKKKKRDIPRATRAWGNCIRDFLGFFLLLYTLHTLTQTLTYRILPFIYLYETWTVLRFFLLARIYIYLCIENDGA